MSAPLSGVYVTSKFAAVGLTEALHHDLTMQPDHQVGTSVIVPAAVDAGIGKSERNRPEHLTEQASTKAWPFGQALVETAAAGADPRVVAERILVQAEAGTFAISTNDAYAKHITVANEDRLHQRPPPLPDVRIGRPAVPVRMAKPPVPPSTLARFPRVSRSTR